MSERPDVEPLPDDGQVPGSIEDIPGEDDEESEFPEEDDEVSDETDYPGDNDPAI